MSLDRIPTGYARLGPPAARIVLASFVLLSLFCMGVALSPLAQGRAARLAEGAGDVPLYRAGVDRVHAGEGYYAATAAELTARGYPTRSVFNWRPPLPHWLLGKLPAIVLGKALLALLAAAVVVLAYESLAREQGGRIGIPLFCALLLTGITISCLLGDLFVTPSLWAGTWIGLSLCFYGLKRPYLGVAAGLAAVFFRELAMPYCLVAAGIAWHDGRRRELAAWLVGLAAWAAFYGLHCWHVLGLIAPDARGHAQGWVQFGGAPFVIATAKMNFWLILLPQWIAAIYFAAAMLGLAGWHTRMGLRCGLTVSAFVLAFAVVGQPFNTYWGWLIAPALCFGAARAPASLADLYKAAMARPPKDVPAPACP
jgi:hypothetical protein